MMNYKFAQPVTIGDLANPVTVQELTLHSVSLTLDPERPVLSVVLEHKDSGWKHVVTYTDSTAVEFWARAQEAHFDAICEALLAKLAGDGKLPPGALNRGA